MPIYYITASGSILINGVSVHNYETILVFKYQIGEKVYIYGCDKQLVILNGEYNAGTIVYTLSDGSTVNESAIYSSDEFNYVRKQELQNEIDGNQEYLDFMSFYPNIVN